ncbi:1414_t:CDS:2 [Acaulospora colombiana]|uniref:1414_t:CDS:1 n=1 Tax=Acaulospora colombiana TaxID=27376 RepID=A0ACA9KSE4_9GLOM|nr:1414_t:CDS:2 [Acaulospora colombiana]
MEELPVEEKLKIVSGFLLESPPGEVNDVYRDVKVLIGDENQEEFERGIGPSLQQYNIEQYVTATLPGQEEKVIVSKFGQIEDDIYLDPRSQQTFRFNHSRHGNIKVNVHYYEDGNVQLDSSKEIEITSLLESEDPNERAAAYAKSINKAEHEFQSALNEAYVELSENTFKGLRRALPLTRHKLDWDK